MCVAVIFFLHTFLFRYICRKVSNKCFLETKFKKKVIITRNFKFSYFFLFIFIHHKFSKNFDRVKKAQSDSSEYTNFLYLNLALIFIINKSTLFYIKKSTKEIIFTRILLNLEHHTLK